MKERSAPAESAEAPTSSAGELATMAETQPLRAAQRIMAHLRSPDGCSWDREQTFDSIRRHTLEEVYEVFDAIERRAWPELRDELGDLLLQVLFYTQMAAEEDRFTLDDVARALNRKLIRRHPHIFGDVAVADSAAVKRNWDEIKRAERREKGADGGSLLADVARSMPALSEAGKLGRAAAKVGFDWAGAGDVLAKAREELLELEAELQDAPADTTDTAGASSGEGSSSAVAIEDEFGDVLFTMVSLGRHLGVDPEMALRGANAKFRRRFAAMEASVGGEGAALAQRSSGELEALWAEAKRRDGQETGA